MRDEIPTTKSERIFMIVVNLHPSDGTQWVQTMKRNDVVFILIVLAYRNHQNLHIDMLISNLMKL